MNNYLFDLPIELQHYIFKFLIDKKQPKNLLTPCFYYNNICLSKRYDQNIFGNFINFFLEFNIKKSVDVPYCKLNKLLNNKHPHSFINKLDHIRAFYTYNKKYIIIFSPYSLTEYEKYAVGKGFNKYNYKLYNYNADTYYLVLT